jgi:hypothetical protein
MRRHHHLRNALLTIAIATLPGCLSLGGKTVYTSDSPQTADRVSALETRVSLLEQAVTGKSPPASVPVEPRK